GADAKRTAAVANAVAQALVDVGNGRKDQTRVTLSVLAAASVPAAPSSPKPPLELAVGTAAGLLLGGLSVLAGIGRTAARRGPGPAVQSAVAIDPRIPLPAVPALEPGTRAITFYAPVTDQTVPAVGRAVVIRRDER